MSEPSLVAIVAPEHCDKRFDKTLVRLYPEWSRRMLKAMLKEKRVYLNDAPARIETQAQVGDRVEIRPADLSAAHVELELIHETDCFLYLNKRSGDHVIAKYPGQPGTIASALAKEFPQCVAASEDPRDGGAVHRLDGPTSGVLAVAKNPQAYREGRLAMSEGRARKDYIAAVDALPLVQDPRLLMSEGTLPDLGAVELGPLPDSWAPEKPAPGMEVRASLGTLERADRVGITGQGRPCHSTLYPWARLREQPRRRLVWLTLHTGMRHQLRVHMAALGHPIAHDPTYGPYLAPSHRLALHAWRLDLGNADQDCGPITAALDPRFLVAAATGSFPDTGRT